MSRLTLREAGGYHRRDKNVRARAFFPLLGPDPAGWIAKAKPSARRARIRTEAAPHVTRTRLKRIAVCKQRNEAGSRREFRELCKHADFGNGRRNARREHARRTFPRSISRGRRGF